MKHLAQLILWVARVAWVFELGLLLTLFTVSAGGVGYGMYLDEEFRWQMTASLLTCALFGAVTSLVIDVCHDLVQWARRVEHDDA